MFLCVAITSEEGDDLGSNNTPSSSLKGGHEADSASVAFDGSFDKIAASGAGPLHLPSFGQNDFVFDANGTKVDSQDPTPVCGVYRNYAFQLMDQDSPQAPIQEQGIAIKEKLSAGPPVTSSTNNAGQILDTHALVNPVRCLQRNEFSDITQSFVVDISEGSTTRSFNLTTTMHIEVGNINGQLTEQTEVTHQ